MSSAEQDAGRSGERGNGAVSRRMFLGGAGLASAAGYMASTGIAAATGPDYYPALPARFPDEQKVFSDKAEEIYAKHWAQTPADVEALRAKYATPIYGEVDPCDLLDELARCIDLTDRTLYVTSQWVHVQQILRLMEQNGVTDEDLYFLALVHDLGKVLMLVGEEQENVVCGNRPIGEYEPGVGLDNVTFQWNHDEFIYDRLVDHVPDPIAWTVRYHSVRLEEVEHLMDDRDREYSQQYLQRFQPYDIHSKSVFIADLEVIERWKPLLRERLPETLVF